MERKDFHHPFQPYDIQQQFMEAVYDCIERGKVGIFESPTGTGKSLSLICGSLTWLREHKRNAFEEAATTVLSDDDEPQWMVQHAQESRIREERLMRADLEARLEAVRQREQKIRGRNANGEPPAKRRRQTNDNVAVDDAGEEQFLLDDYDSDDGNQHSRNGKVEYSSETTKLMEKLGMVQKGESTREIAVDHDELKIFFCSRTHSQLSQFVGELKRFKLPSGLPPEPDDIDAAEALKHLTLGSRKNLCINSKVARLSSLTAINEKCMELQQSSTPSDHKCPYLPNKNTQDLVLDFRDHALAKIRDIEDLATVGKQLQICPYYASRPAIGPAEIVTLPYPLLLQKSARESLGISLKGHVVIIDEAHNLANAVEGIYSSQLSEAQLRRARESLIVYLQKFRNRLKGRNRMYVAQVVRVADSILQAMMSFSISKQTGGAIDSSTLMSGTGVDQVDLSKLVRYINESKLARKVEAYTAHIRDQDAKPHLASPSTGTADVPTLTHLQNFLVTLMNPSKEGRFFWSVEEGFTSVRYLLLDPAEHFRDIAEDARAVILAGGTMSPMDGLKQQLFPYVASVETLSCGHLIPPSSLLVRTIATDRDGPLEFSFKARNDPSSATRVGQVIISLAPLMKGGFVIFFPSYGYMDQVTSSWRQSSIIESLRKVKPIFTDSRSGSAEETFRAYSDAISSNNDGAILLSVIGGKLSEGINFSDNLGRCVLVVGLPFPNLETSEWKAKMQYIDQKAVSRGEPKGKAGREHAENVCMRSVNQAIGRVIRHKDDWASILLMDSRYAQDRIRGKLPGWIKDCHPATNSDLSTAAYNVVTDVAKFFSREAAQ